MPIHRAACLLAAALSLAAPLHAAAPATSMVRISTTSQQPDYNSQSRHGRTNLKTPRQKHINKPAQPDKQHGERTPNNDSPRTE
ncbi:MAG: hypothetical protein JHC52_08260, partial [Chthoniobacterales bacterium]|nr:hypothetical protein [Chthoniobacterales bacterium]